MTDEFQTEVSEDPTDNQDDPAFLRAVTLRTDAQEVVDENKDNWEDAQDMYLDCFRGWDDPVEQNNPVMLKQVIDRGMDRYSLVDYILRVTDSNPQETQIIRDCITQIEENSGLRSAMQDDPRGNLGQFLYGNALYWFGASDREDTPILFQNIRLTQAFFPKQALMMRSANSFSDVEEAFLLFDRTYDEQLGIYEKAKNADIGRIPVLNSINKVQKTDLSEDEERMQLTQDGHYYNIRKGVYKVYVGSKATIVKEYDDNNPNLPNYPFKVNGKNVIPIIWMRTFPVPDSIYAKGFYDLFGKTARNSAWRKSQARQWVDKNVNPPAFVQMSSNNFTEFQNQIDIQAEARRIGEDSYVQISPDEQVIPGDLRNSQLTGDFERLARDDVQEIAQSGISIQDVLQPTSKKVGIASLEERNKIRLIAQVIKNNAQEGKFIREVIIEFIKKFVKKSNKTPVATRLKMQKKPGEKDLQRAQQISAEQQISVDQALTQILDEFSVDGMVTFGQVAETLRQKGKLVTVQTDFSAWEDTGLKFTNLQNQLNVAIGTPEQVEIQKELLQTLGRDVNKQNIRPPTQVPPTQTPRAGTQPGLPTRLPGTQGIEL